jgi:hypothetical protein
MCSLFHVALHRTKRIPFFRKKKGGQLSRKNQRNLLTRWEVPVDALGNRMRTMTEVG